MTRTGQPAPFSVTAPAFAVAVVGWLAATGVLVTSARALARGAIFDDGLVLSVHLIGLVFFPFAVAAAVWQLLPVMLRNDPPTARLRGPALVLLAAGAPLAVGIALGRDQVAAATAPLVALGMLLVLGEVATIVRRAPRGKTLVVSRPAVALALLHAAAAFALGTVLVSTAGAEPLGVPYERFLLAHVSVALVGWLTVLVAAVGRTLVPMLGLAAAAGRRAVPVPEAAIVAGLWIYVGGLVSGAQAAVVAGIAGMLAGLMPVVRLFVRVAARGRIGAREGPVAHAAVGLFFAVQAAALGLAGAAHGIGARRAAIAAVLLLGVGWAAGLIVGHLGKLVSLSGWGSWPPGPRPKQESLYPRRVWQLEVVLFACAVQLLALGVLTGSSGATLFGAVLLGCAALTAAAGVGETLRRVAVARPRA